jgi:hypothetical protein
MPSLLIARKALSRFWLVFIASVLFSLCVLPRTVHSQTVEEANKTGYGMANLARLNASAIDMAGSEWATYMAQPKSKIEGDTKQAFAFRSLSADLSDLNSRSNQSQGRIQEAERLASFQKTLPSKISVGYGAHAKRAKSGHGVAAKKSGATSYWHPSDLATEVRVVNR